jgi:diguanylate cyclase (GGDEF)-like protein/PAS domain S-box-containing protein
MNAFPAADIFRLAVEAADFGVIVGDASHPRRPVIYVNPAFERMTGYAPSEVLGRSCSFLQGTDRKQREVFWLRHALGSARPITVTLRNYRKSGEMFWNRLSITPSFDEAGQLRYFVGVLHDVTLDVEAETRTWDILDRVGDAYYALDTEWRFTYVNRHAAQVLDRPVDDLLGRCVWDEFPGALNSPLETNYRRAMRQMIPATFVLFFPPLDKWFEVRAFPGRDGLAVYFRDITEQHTREGRLQYLAAHDTLTGLPNRGRCLAILNEAVDAAARHERELAVIYFDLDGFKEINDSIGHSAGDGVLRQLTGRLLARCPPNCVLTRFSGDEFVLVVASRDAEGLLALAQDMIDAMRQPIPVPDRHLQVGASAGIAIFPDGGNDPEALLVNADLAMLAAKRRGRGQALLFDETMLRVQRRRMQLLHELKLARLDEQVSVHYQPKLRAGNGELGGFEALSRWTHPQLGPVSPAEFVPLAEESGEIVRLGAWVVRTVCRQIRNWLDEGLQAVPVSVNASVGQIESSDFLEVVDTALAAYAVPPWLLQVEITESLLIHNFEAAGRVVDGLTERGVDVHLDDFGAGYSSLSYLWRLPVACVKLDHSFTRGLSKGGGAEAVVRSAIELAHSLSKTVVAEGVETPDQEAMLCAMGCDQLQGFWFSRPVPADAATAFLRNKSS